jgi:hypothetical protein
MYPLSDLGLPVGSNNRRVLIDDDVAISSLYDSYLGLSTSAVDVGTNLNGSTWTVSSTAISGGYQIYQRGGFNTWYADTTGRGAIRIAVDPNGYPWIVDNLHRVFRGLSNSVFTMAWQQMPGNATDIGSGGGGVWMVTDTPIWGAEYTMAKWDESSWSWISDAANGGARRIAVSDSGIPWVVTVGGNIWTRTSSDPHTGGWTQLPTPGMGVAATGVVSDIGLTADTHPWIIRTDNGNSTAVFVWNEQSPAAWTLMFEGIADTGGVSIAVDGEGRPIFTRQNNSVVTPAK